MAFVCPTCGKNYNKKCTLLRHQREKHEICVECGKEKGRNHQCYRKCKYCLQNIETKPHECPPRRCVRCNQQFRTVTLLKEHKCTACKLCNEIFTDYQEHKKVCIKLECHYCHNRYLERSHVVDHEKKCRMKSFEQCPKCGEKGYVMDFLNYPCEAHELFRKIDELNS